MREDPTDPVDPWPLWLQVALWSAVVSMLLYGMTA